MEILKKLFSPIKDKKDYLGLNILYYKIEIIVCMIFIPTTTMYFIYKDVNIIFIIAFSLGLVLLIVFFGRMYTNFMLGKHGEECVKKVLENIPVIKALHNVTLPGQRGNIDHIVFSKNGIFCVETKAKRPSKCTVYKKDWYCNGKKLESSPSVQVWQNTRNLQDFLATKGIPNTIVRTGIVVLVGNVTIIKKYPPLQIVLIEDLKQYIDNFLQSSSPIEGESIRQAYKLIKAYAQE